jgi:hypothetical protein
MQGEGNLPRGLQNRGFAQFFLGNGFCEEKVNFTWQDFVSPLVT